MRTPRLIAGLAVGTLLLTGCATAADEPESSGTDDGETTAAATTAAATEEAAGSAATDGGTEPSATEAGGDVTIVHAQGETVVPVNPETVVTFDLGALDTLDAMGVEVDGVPEIVSLPDRLSQYASDDYAKVGSLFEPDYEAVNAMEPDLIIVAARSAEAYPQLSEIAPTIDLTTDSTDFMNSFATATESLGAIFDMEDEAAAQLAAVDERVETISAQAADAGTGLILLTSAGEVSAYGPGSRFGIVHDVLGVTPAVEDVEAATHGDAVSFEFVLEADPDMLYVLDRDATIGEEGETAEQILDNELVAQTTAWSEGAVTYLDGADWYLVMSGMGAVNSMLDDVESSLS